ncbi:hypothetical protein B0I22_3261 [Epilithonimonas xixisoli]|uniref:Uncharacterized protein n=1 Tax=Epilithonimonas xixisoli TaxID=1476462 RepID=A0A4R8IDL6_9FLAO|nr:hypothetical protein B0I22_3261 [Epilithonimonas xixisoli]
MFQNHLRPDLNGTPFLWLEKPWQKEWEWKAEKTPKLLKYYKIPFPCRRISGSPEVKSTIVEAVLSP